jgi:hypothetical protein
MLTGENVGQTAHELSEFGVLKRRPAKVGTDARRTEQCQPRVEQIVGRTLRRHSGIHQSGSTQESKQTDTNSNLKAEPQRSKTNVNADANRSNEEKVNEEERANALFAEVDAVSRNRPLPGTALTLRRLMDGVAEFGVCK